jgi:adenine/guanine phosphoribosyltransferase-like PRPP-binding protein
MITRSEAAIPQILAWRALKTLSKHFELGYLYEILAENKIRISQPELKRYIAGTVLPPQLKAVHIIQALRNENVFAQVVQNKLKIDENGVVNVAELAYDEDVLTVAMAEAYLSFFRSVDVVLTAAVNGIPLASLLAWVLDAKLAVARRERESQSIKYLSAQIFQTDPPSIVHIYLPANHIPKNSRVLIADDLLRLGRTLKALLNIVRDADAYTVGVFAIISLSNAWRSVLGEEVRSRVLLNIQQ